MLGSSSPVQCVKAATTRMEMIGNRGALAEQLLRQIRRDRQLGIGYAQIVK